MRHRLVLHRGRDWPRNQTPPNGASPCGGPPRLSEQAISAGSRRGWQKRPELAAERQIRRIVEPSVEPRRAGYSRDRSADRDGSTRGATNYSTRSAGTAASHPAQPANDSVRPVGNEGVGPGEQLAGRRRIQVVPGLLITDPHLDDSCSGFLASAWQLPPSRVPRSGHLVVPRSLASQGSPRTTAELRSDAIHSNYSAKASKIIGRQRAPSRAASSSVKT